MANLLLVPVHLDALLLEHDRMVADARADFSRLPFCDERRDWNADSLNLGETASAQPLQSPSLYLKAGVHLHWSLPDALTRGVQRPEGTEFPAVPNRWLVIRSSPSPDSRLAIEQAWVVESDYLYPDGAGDAAASVSFPASPNRAKGEARPFRLLGRAMPLHAWRARDPQAHFLPKLTAVGYGDPIFAAFYPSCRSVFGFYDAEAATIPAAGLQYDVVGWYSDGAQDMLARLIAAATSANGGRAPGDQALLHALQQQAGWTVAIPKGQSFPTRMLCYARLSFAPGATATPNPVLAEPDPMLTVGHTGTEALAACLARMIDADNRSIIEDQLEAVQMIPHFEGQHLNVGDTFREARHEKGFRSIPGGSLWSVRAESASGAAKASDAGERAGVRLPEGTAQWLDGLNRLQGAYDRAIDQIEAMREQLFADWYKYMLCAYPSQGAAPLNADDLRHRIEARDLPALRARLAGAGTLRLAFDKAGALRAADAAASRPSSLAAQLATGLNGLIRMLDGANASASPQAALALKTRAAPRYWQPSEPAITICGPLAQPSKRHGQDGRLRADGQLECQLLANASIDSLIPGDIAALRTRIGQIGAAGGEQIGFHVYRCQPWNPLLLEWEAMVFPLAGNGKLLPEAGHYDPEFVCEICAPPGDGPDLAVRPEHSALAGGASAYLGTSILTPHASLQLGQRLAAYLGDAIVSAYCADNHLAPPPPEQVEAFLDREIDALIQWYENHAPHGTPAERAADTTNSVLCAYRHLRTLGCLSQSLSGFNDALLMRKQTMQLAPAEPLGFADYQAFTQAVRESVGNHNRSAPMPYENFHPIRNGALKLTRLRLIDTFGQIRDLDCSVVRAAERLTTPGSDQLVWLPPRLTQPALLHFRWLAANDTTRETNADPATSPICGWLLGNELDRSLLIYDASGQALGRVDQRAIWRSAPGAPAKAAHEAISNQHLLQLVEWLIGRGAAFLADFVALIDEASAQIDPENYAQHLDLALLVGRPFALVRASLALELHGLPAVHQGWDRLRPEYTDDGPGAFTDVRFPIRLGDAGRLNDGLLGYWREAGGTYGDEFHTPYAYGQITPYAGGPLCQAVAAPPQTLAMLVDPRAAVHAASGVVPTKAIGIPPEQYIAALRAIEATFMFAPILSERGKISLPLPQEPGYAWSWLQPVPGGWAEVSTTPAIRLARFGALLAEQIVQRLLQPTVGWLEPVPGDPARLRVVAPDRRPAAAIGAEFAALQPLIEPALARPGVATLARQALLDELAAGVAAQVWRGLLEADVGWLRPAGHDPARAWVVAADQRRAATLSGPLAGLEPAIALALGLGQEQIEPAGARAGFGAGQEIREGWLKLTPEAD